MSTTPSTLPTCPTCGASYWRMRPQQAYCSEPCRRKAERQRRAERDRVTTPPVACPVCETPFRPVGNQRYCSQRCRAKQANADTPAICPECGNEFERDHEKRRYVYCSQQCASRGSRLTLAGSTRTKRGETAAIVPSETRSGRNRPMTDGEFEAAYQAIRRELMATGQPLYRDDAPAARTVSVKA